MNKLMILVLCGTILSSVAANGGHTVETDHSKGMPSGIQLVQEESDGDLLQIPNPIKDYASQEEAEKAIGFKMKMPAKMLEGYKIDHIYTVADHTVRVVYSNGENEITFGQGKGHEDISGDYNEYSQIQTVHINGLKVTMKGNHDKVNVAIWNEGEYTFAMGISSLETEIENPLEAGIEKDEMTAIISSIK